MADDSILEVLRFVGPGRLLKNSHVVFAPPRRMGSSTAAATAPAPGKMGFADRRPTIRGAASRSGA